MLCCFFMSSCILSTLYLVGEKIALPYMLSPSTIESTWQNKRPRVRVSCSIFFHELLFGTSWNTFIWFSDSFTTIVPSFGEPCFFTGHFPAKRRLKRICLLQWACALCPNRGVRGSSEVQWPDARLADDAIGKQAGDVGFSVFQPHKKSDSVVWIRISVFSLFFRMKYGEIRRVHRSNYYYKTSTIRMMG